MPTCSTTWAEERAQGSGFRVQGSEFRVQDLGDDETNAANPTIKWPKIKKAGLTDEWEHSVGQTLPNLPRYRGTSLIRNHPTPRTTLGP